MARYRTIENLLRRPINQQKSITVYHNLAQIFLTKNAYLQYSDCRCYQVSNINMKKYLLIVYYYVGYYNIGFIS